MANLVTETIFPAVFSQSSAEFRLNMSPGYTRLRLARLGVTTPAGTTASYTDTAGVYGLLSRVALYDGGTLLDELVDAYAWAAFQNLRRAGPGRDNGLDYSLFTPLTASSRSYAVAPAGDVMTHLSTRNGSLATSDANTTAKGWLSLDSLLNFVARAGVLDTRAMPGLRLLVEWRSDPALLFAGTNPAIGAVTILSPVLLAERMDEAGLAAMPAAPAVGYNRILTERVSIGGTAAVLAPPAVELQSVGVRLLAPLGHSVNRLVCAAVRSDAPSADETAADDIKDGGSEIFEGEVWQFAVNGENLLPYGGCDTWARKQHLLWQAWGDLHVPQGGGCQAITNAAPPVNALAGLYDVARVQTAVGGFAGSLERGPLVGKLSYFGAIIGRRVSDLQLRYSRQLTARRPGGVTLRFFYECPAVVSGIDPRDPAGYTVAFA